MVTNHMVVRSSVGAFGAMNKRKVMSAARREVTVIAEAFVVLCLGNAGMKVKRRHNASFPNLWMSVSNQKHNLFCRTPIDRNWVRRDRDTAAPVPEPLRSYLLSVDDGSKNQRVEMCTYCSTTQKGTCEMWCSAISIHNQFPEPVEVVGARLISAGVFRGLSMGVTARVMGRGGRHDTRSNRRWREKAVSTRGDEAHAIREGTGPLVALPSTLFEAEREEIEVCCLWVTPTYRKENVSRSLF